jgi:uncharacterized protein RhaS with RHS repeats
MYYRARYYDAGIGRFGREDPLPSDLNRYACVANQATLFTDPSGEITCKCRRRLRLLGQRRRHWYSPDHVYLRVGPAPECAQNPSYGFFGEISPIFSYRGHRKAQ